MLPEMAVVKIPYESSLAPKQTVDGVICIHPMAGKKISRFWMDFLIFLNKNIRMGYTPAAGKEKEDKQTYSVERQRGIKRDFWMRLDSSKDNQNLFSFEVFHGVKAFLRTTSYLTIAAFVSFWANTSIPFVCKSSLASPIVLARSLSTSVLTSVVREVEHKSI